MDISYHTRGGIPTGRTGRLLSPHAIKSLELWVKLIVIELNMEQPPWY